MDIKQFDHLSRQVAALSSRRQILRALIGGLAGWTLAGIDRSRASADEHKVFICHRTSSDTNQWEFLTIADSATGVHSTHHGDLIDVDLMNDRDHCGACGVACGLAEVCREGECVAACTSFILSGGMSPAETIGVDDDLALYLNGIQFFFDPTPTFASEIPPIHFTAQSGDLLRVVATDVDPFCRGIDPLYLHCASSGAIQVLDGDGQQEGCAAIGTRPPNFVFYDQTFTIALP